MHSSLRTHTILVYEALGSFVLWSLDNILADLASHQGVKKAIQQSSLKSLVPFEIIPLYDAQFGVVFLKVLHFLKFNVDKYIPILFFFCFFYNNT